MDKPWTRSRSPEPYRVFYWLLLVRNLAAWAFWLWFTTHCCNHLKKRKEKKINFFPRTTAHSLHRFIIHNVFTVVWFIQNQEFVTQFSHWSALQLRHGKGLWEWSGGNRLIVSPKHHSIINPTSNASTYSHFKWINKVIKCTSVFQNTAARGSPAWETTYRFLKRFSLLHELKAQLSGKLANLWRTIASTY